ncbi:MAG: YkgJ family cysteine cluster protein [Planctomycetota bacterium]|nr:YkgJ family cysteine cluster protein [Planctomycetota bacterium]
MPVTQKDDSPWWADGLPFTCQQSGKCCHARGDYAWVYVGWPERERLAQALQITPEEFTQKYTITDAQGARILRFVDGHCIFLEDAACQVHDHKPVQCRTWPFWEELLESPETYEAEVRNFCPGSRSGKRISADEIRRQMKETEEARQ